MLLVELGLLTCHVSNALDPKQHTEVDIVPTTSVSNSSATLCDRYVAVCCASRVSVCKMKRIDTVPASTFTIRSLPILSRSSTGVNDRQKCSYRKGRRCCVCPPSSGSQSNQYRKLSKRKPASKQSKSTVRRKAMRHHKRRSGCNSSDSGFFANATTVLPKWPLLPSGSLSWRQLERRERYTVF